MAVDTTIPNSSNNVENDLSAIRENFELLASAQVVDEGSTSDGYYIRWENGWQICTVEYGVDLTSTSSANDVPMSFIDAEQFTGYGGVDNADPGSGGDGQAIVRAFTRLTQPDRFQFRCNGDGDSSDFKIVGIAIGRWK